MRANHKKNLQRAAGCEAHKSSSCQPIFTPSWCRLDTAIWQRSISFMFFWIPFCGINVKPQDVAPHGGIPYPPCQGTKFGPPRSKPNVAKGVRRNFRRRSRWSFWDQVINILDIFSPKLRAILPLKIGRLGPKKEVYLVFQPSIFQVLLLLASGRVFHFLVLNVNFN